MRTMLALAAAVALLTVPSAAAVDNGAPGDTGDDEVGAIGAPYDVDSGWDVFSWWGAGDVFAFDTYEFTNEVPVEVRVTDAFCYGDQFRIYDNGQEISDTSAPGRDDCGGPFNADDAYDDPDMSSRCLFLLPGSHSISIEVIENPFGAGAGFFRADTPANGNAVDCLQHSEVLAPSAGALAQPPAS